MKTLYYVIVNKRGNLAVLNKQLPIYWNKEVAENVCRGFPLPQHKVITIKIKDLMTLLQSESFGIVGDKDITDFGMMLLNDNSWLNVSTMHHVIKKTVEWVQCKSQLN